jgi:hydroxyacylglutathione hydrolase
MDTLEVIALPAFEDNYIWLLRHGRNVVAVDPGDAAPVLDYLAASGMQLCAVLATHHHGDHVGGIDALVAGHPAPVYGPASEAIGAVDHPLTDHDRVVLTELDAEFEVLAVPGHTRGHLAYYRRGMLFCGDTLFGAGCGRLFEGSPADMHASLARLAKLPADTRVYCAHEYTAANLRFAAAVEPDNAAVRQRIAATAKLRDAGQASVPSTLADELATNPFLRWDAPAVVAAARTRLGHAPQNAVEVFATIREWKNRF